MLAGWCFGSAAFRIAQVPAVANLALATTVALLVWRWSRRVRVPQPVQRHYLPRARIAVVALALVAAVLGVRELPHLSVVLPRPTVAAHLAPLPPSH
jgi:hypothetical protein